MIPPLRVQCLGLTVVHYNPFLFITPPPPLTLRTPSTQVQQSRSTWQKSGDSVGSDVEAEGRDDVEEEDDEEEVEAGEEVEVEAEPQARREG